MIASCGGFPKDINLIQSHKAVHNGAMFVRDGGLLLVYCECRDGIGSKTFLPWFNYNSFAEAFEELANKYEGNGGTALAMMTKLQRIRIGLITQLDHETCKLIGVEKWSHEQVEEHLSISSNDSIAYVLITNNDGHNFLKYKHSAPDSLGLIGSWEDRSNNLPDDFNSQGGYDLHVRVSPSDENFIYFVV